MVMQIKLIVVVVVVVVVEFPIFNIGQEIFPIRNLKNITLVK